MKKTFRLFIVLIGILTFSSCAIHTGYMNNSTSLSQPNFRYVHNNITGKATTVKVLGIGGLAQKAIVEEAKEDMLRNHPLQPNQALANINVSWKTGFYFIFTSKRCTVSADIVEFK